MPAYEIPLISASQSFNISLAGITYKVSVLWRDAHDGGWFLDLYDQTGAAILQGAAVVTGTDILGQYEYLGIGGALYVYSDADAFADATYGNLGTDSHLYFVVA